MAGLLASAIQAWQRGDLRTAELECRQVLKQQPWNGDALNMLGSIAGSVGKFEAGLDLLRKAVAAGPKVPTFRENLARMLMQLGKSDEAEITLREVDMSDQSPAMWSLWGAILGQNGKLEKGIEFAAKAVEAEPEQPMFLYNLAELQRRSGDRASALENFKRLLQFAPEHIDALNNLSGLQLAEGEFLGALHNVEKLLQVAPHSSQAYFNLGKLLSAAGDPESAATAYQNAVKLDPKSDRAKFQLANSLGQIGKFDEAEHVIKEMRAGHEDSDLGKVLHARILERKGDVDAAADIIASIRQEHRGNPDVASMIALIQEQQGDYEAAVQTLTDVLDSNEATKLDWVAIHFSLGDLYDRLGRFDEAFEHYLLGNENRKKAFFKGNQDLDASSQKMSARLIEQYAKESYEAKPDSGLETDRPIFIVGMPRSGTSLTEQILASHSKVFGGGELKAFHDAVIASYPRPASASKTAFEIVASDPSEGLSCLVPNNWEHITAEQLAEIGQRYLDALSQINADAERVTDKMPFNFYSVPLIHKVFPNAKILHCSRDPLDTCLSCYFQNFASGNRYAFGLETLGAFYREYEAIMQAWRDLGIPMFEVRYETMVVEPEPTVREMLGFCGLPWDANCLEFHKSKRPIATASYQQVRQPIYTQSVGRWKNYESHLTPLSKALGLSSSTSST